MQNMASHRGESTYFEVQRTTFLTGRRSMCKINTFSQNVVWLQDYKGFRVVAWPHFLQFFIFYRPLSKTTKSQKPLQNLWWFSVFIRVPRVNIADQNRWKSIGFIAVFTFFQILRFCFGKIENRQNTDFDVLFMTFFNYLLGCSSISRFSCKNDEFWKLYGNRRRFGGRHVLLPG